MNRLEFSPKQRQVLDWWRQDGFDAVICDGAVRSGKTFALGLSFFLWAMARFQRQRFGLCAASINGVRRNLLAQARPVLEGLGFKWEEKVSRNEVTLRGGGRENLFYLYGGGDEGSYAAIQGVTLAGVLLDEVVLMPESFVNQALARCSVECSRIWFSCNPDHPNHWFKREWIDKREERNALYLHFEMTDNPSLSEKTLARYQSMYSGVFYDRYVRGLWVVAEGLVYPMFSEGRHMVDDIPWQALQRGRWYISMDYGTVNPTAAGLWCLWQGEAYMVQEYYYDSRKPGNHQLTDEEHYAALERLSGDRRIERVIVDPSAASFKETVRRHGKFAVWDADNSVLDGIRLTASLLNADRILIHRSCKGILSEFGQYRWDMDALEDAVIKEFDHGMDQLRYFCATIMEREVRGNGI